MNRHIGMSAGEYVEQRRQTSPAFAQAYKAQQKDLAIARQIRIARKNLQLNRRALARRAGVSRSTIRRLEMGRLPDSDRVVRITAALRIQVVT